MFTKARIKLTGWYLLVFLMISTTFSVVFYVRTASVIDAEFERVQQRLMLEEDNMFPGMRQQAPRFQILPEDIEHAKQQIVYELLLINVALSSIIVIAGYILSGQTLKPIENAMEEQKRFIADAAHELRTPITALKTATEVNLMDEELQDVAREVLTDNLADIKGLESLTNNLLELARHDTNHLPMENVNLKEILHEAIEKVSPLAKQKNIQINQNAFDQGLSVYAHSESLMRMVVILLDNAIKYSSDQSTIDVFVSGTKQTVSISVSDHGIGISPEHLPNIFQRFYRADQSRSRSKAGGFGLGLSVADEIARKHNGSIHVDSVEGQGSTFTITLPRKS